jgi:hypothetical protein
VVVGLMVFKLFQRRWRRALGSMGAGAPRGRIAPAAIRDLTPRNWTLTSSYDEEGKDLSREALGADWQGPGDLDAGSRDQEGPDAPY